MCIHIQNIFKISDRETFIYQFGCIYIDLYIELMHRVIHTERNPTNPREPIHACHTTLSSNISSNILKHHKKCRYTNYITMRSIQMRWRDEKRWEGHLKKKHMKRKRWEKERKEREVRWPDRKKLFLQRTRVFSHPTGTFFCFLPYSCYNFETSALGRFNAIGYPQILHSSI
jgi:hypothetical protein